MLISLVLLAVSGLLLFAADGLAQGRLGRTQTGSSNLAGSVVSHWDVDDAQLPAVALNDQPKAPPGLNRRIMPQTAQRP